MIKVGDNYRSWLPLGHYLWERAHGPVPAGRVLVRLDGDSQNDRPGNFAAMSHAEKGRHYATLYPERAAIHTARQRRATGKSNRERAAIRHFYSDREAERAGSA